MHDQAMVHGDLKGVWLQTPTVTQPPNPFPIKANILIDHGGHARLADFGFLAIVSDPTNPTASSSYTIGGTIRWMSPELLGLKESRPTKQSDCYAIGMVIYEVLGGRPPFTPFSNYIVIHKVMDGERPERPRGTEGAWFTNWLWRMLNRCWNSQPKRRPIVSAVLECLERVSRDQGPPPLQVDGDSETDEGGWSLASDSSRKFSWFDPRCFVVLLRRILCKDHTAKAVIGKVVPSKRGPTELCVP